MALHKVKRSIFERLRSMSIQKKIAYAFSLLFILLSVVQACLLYTSRCV